MDTPSGIKDSIPAWIKFSVQAPNEIPYNGIYYDPPEEVCFQQIWCLGVSTNAITNYALCNKNAMVKERLQ